MNKNKHLLIVDFVLLLTAAIWGFAFIAQRVGMAYIGPLAFNAIRFLVGGFILLVVSMIFRKSFLDEKRLLNGFFPDGFLTGLVLFLGASLQQIGIVGTSASKAGFITGLYVVLVPILGLMIGKPTSRWNWLGAVIAVFGLFLLSVQGNFSILTSDIIVLLGAFIWAVHVQLVGHYSPRIGSVRLAIMQFMVCGFMSLIGALVFEKGFEINWMKSLAPLLYGSVLSVGLAYTLQVVAQQKADPSHSAIILSLESLFAAIGGWLILKENLGLRGWIGAGLMLMGMLVSQKRTTYNPN